MRTDKLESMDRLGNSQNCWASGVPDVDYSQRLVFSDEEDVPDKGFVSRCNQPTFSCRHRLGCIRQRFAGENVQRLMEWVVSGLVAFLGTLLAGS